ncbi:hypothetical protein GCM10020001_025290 [Nonomuraea salmonea]
MLCTVTTHGTPARCAARTPIHANGDTAPRVHVDDVGTRRGDAPREMPHPERVDGQVERHRGDDPVHTGQRLSPGRRGHRHLVPGLPLHAHEIGDLDLDPPESRQVTVTHVKDPHPSQTNLGLCLHVPLCSSMPTPTTRPC